MTKSYMKDVEFLDGEMPAVEDEEFYKLYDKAQETYNRSFNNSASNRHDVRDKAFQWPIDARAKITASDPALLEDNALHLAYRRIKVSINSDNRYNKRVFYDPNESAHNWVKSAKSVILNREPSSDKLGIQQGLDIVQNIFWSLSDSYKTPSPQADVDRALQWLRAAADPNTYNMPEAQSLLGQLHEYGRIIPRDLDQAARWYKQSIRPDNMHSRVELETLARRCPAAHIALAEFSVEAYGNQKIPVHLHEALKDLEGAVKQIQPQKGGEDNEKLKKIAEVLHDIEAHIEALKPAAEADTLSDKFHEQNYTYHQLAMRASGVELSVGGQKKPTHATDRALRVPDDIENYING